MRLAFAALAASLLSSMPAHADDTVILVAKRDMKDQLYGSTVLVAKPVGNERHVGFILNKPTQATLGKLFPDHAPSQKIIDPVYLGGPLSSEVIFALVQRRESPGSRPTCFSRSTARWSTASSRRKRSVRASSPGW